MPGKNGAVWKVDGLLLLMAVVWGSSYLATKQVTTPETVLDVLVLRFLIAIPALAFAVGGRIMRLSLREIRGGLLLGLILAAIFLLEVFGIVGTSATNAGLIISLTMVFTPLAESGVSRTRPKPALLAAVVLSITGVVLLTQGQGFTRPSAGDVLILLAALARTLHVLVMDRMPSVRGTDTLALTSVQLTGALLVFAVVGGIGGAGPWRVASSLGTAQWLGLLYLALMCTVFAFLVQMWAIRRTSPSRVSLLLGTEPLWAALIGITVARDHMTPVSAIGVVLLLVGTMWGRRAAGETRSSAPAPEIAPAGVPLTETPLREAGPERAAAS